MRVNETHDDLRVWPISAAKYALAARNTSFTSRRFSAIISVVGRSPRSPRSASAWRMQFCNASGCTFNCSASRRITGLGSTPDTDSRYNRTARTQLDGILPVRGDKNGLQDQTWFGSLRKNGEPHAAAAVSLAGVSHLGL